MWSSVTPGFKELSMKEITMHHINKNYKTQLNLILFFFQAPPFVHVTVLKLNKRKGEYFKNHDYLLSETDPSTLS